MTTAAEWIAGARPRTLGAAVAPVVVGTAAASTVGPVVAWRAGAALVVALSLQVGVNYANDYSDGVRGTDAERRGPMRLTASGRAAPARVKAAAGLAFGVAGVFGAALALAVDLRLLAVGVAAVLAAVLYTGGPKPYGYSGLGELVVLVFFGFVATVGSAYVQHRHIPAAAWWGSLAVGLPACALLLVNNIRDVETDAAVGKRTLAVRLGDGPSRRLFVAVLTGGFVAVGLAAVAAGPWALLGLAAAPLAVRPAVLVARGGGTAELVAALGATSLVEVAVAVLLATGLWLS
ncbi:MAG: 1,4-dihydroxy-2-naphthoate polyprenyltransferase [Acidimicrobiia bacterium]|nr:1,4-dihydroxy-2-naphthoate polyprenyltransferase [Acidimicrobiia bacterium]